MRNGINHLVKEKIMRSLQCGCLAVLFLGLIGATYAGQKVVVRYDQADAMQVFGVGDLKKAQDTELKRF